MATGRWVRQASCGALAVWLLAGCSGPLAQAPNPAAAPAAPVAKPLELTDVSVSGAGDAVQITLTTSAKAAYSLVRQSDPPRLALALEGVSVGGQVKAIEVNRGVVTVVKSSSSGSDSSIEVFLSGAAAYEVEGRDTSIVLNVSPKSGGTAVSPAAESPAPVEMAQSEQSAPIVTVAADVSAQAPTVTAPAATAVVPAGPRSLIAVDVKKQADGLVVTLQGDGPLQHEYFLVEGRSLVVDIADAGNKVSPLKKKIDDAWVSQIRIGEHAQPKKVTRVVFDLKKVGEYRVASAGDGITVAFGAPALAAAAAATGEREAAANALIAVGEVICRPLDASTRLEIRTSAKANFTVVDSGDQAKVVVEIANAQIAEKDRKTLDLSAIGREVVGVSAFPYTKGDAKLVRVVAQLRRPVPFRVVAEGDRILIDFEKPPATVVAGESSSSPAPAPPPAPAPVSQAAPAAAPVPAAAGSPAFSGRRLSLDFKDAEVNDILRLISEVSGLNFVAGPEVVGKVTIKLADVPWDQALDIILKTNSPQLTQVTEAENIRRITTVQKMADENKKAIQAMVEAEKIETERQKVANERRMENKLEDFETKRYAISYAKAADIEKVIANGYSSKNGKRQVDERTNTLIVYDAKSILAQIDGIIQALDAQTPAVLVEARIVEVSSGYEQQLGIQWNMAGVADAAHGNATDYAFPNSMSVGGTQSTDAGSYLVNLPAASATSGIGFTFGHIANTLSLDMRLSAMEQLGQTKILSNPKVLVIQNQKAVINVGQQLPVTKTSSEGDRTVEWKDVGILLEVKPQVTNDKRVFLEIKVEKSSQGENVDTTDGTMFSINTSRADTKVLIADGETTVIGGLFVQETIKDESSVPGLSKLPLVGWLFKSKSDTQRKSELMIFLTPRLVPN